MSQRELAAALGVNRSTVARAETGARELPVALLIRAAQLAGVQVALLDSAGAEIPGMDSGAVRDDAGRRFPAHLDVRHGDEDWWHGDERYSRAQPWYTFDRDRTVRDRFRGSAGTPPDHRLPQPGDSPEERTRARLRAALARQEERRVAWSTEQRQLGFPGAWAPACSCPPGCDDLLFAETPLTAEQNAVPHLDDCPCRCDVS